MRHQQTCRALQGASWDAATAAAAAARAVAHAEAYRMASGSSDLPELDRAVLQAYTTLLWRLRRASHLLVLTCGCGFDGAQAAAAAGAPSRVPFCPRSASHPARVHPAPTLAPSAPQVAAQLRALCPSAVLHGTSSCRGCITDDGQRRLRRLLGIHDPHGRYASGLGRGAAAAVSAREAGRAAARSALTNAGEGVLHEMPAVALINGAPGAEEEVLRGVEDELGGGVIAAGGSRADDAYTTARGGAARPARRRRPRWRATASR